MMTIDGNSIGYRNYTVDMTAGTVTDSSDWTRTTQMPVLVSPRFGLKTCTVTIKIPSVSHQDAWDKADAVIKKAKGFHVFGFDGISVALLASSHPIGTLFSAFFISHIATGGGFMDAMIFPPEIASVISGVIIYLCAFMMLFKNRISRLFNAKKKGGNQ